MRKRGRGRTSFVPELVFSTLCVASAIPACSSDGTGNAGGNKDAGTGGLQGVAAGGFGGLAVAAGGFGGATVAAGGFGGLNVAGGGFGGMTVAAGGFGGLDAGDDGDATDATDGDLDAPTEVGALGDWAVTGAFGELGIAPRRNPTRAARGRRARRKR